MGQGILKQGRWVALMILLLGAALPKEAPAFCGFYVGKADAQLYNQASKVILVRHDGKTVISLMNDYKGDLKEFALVVPVPEVLKKGQIHVGDAALFSHLDAYSAPRLVEYFDPDPCMPQRKERFAPMAQKAMRGMLMEDEAKPMARSLGVRIEAQYTVGEYDIVILSAKQSDGLETWLRQSGYNIPKGASKALQPYIRQDIKFFVAKVNLKEQAKTGREFLRPLQFAFSDERFMLPVRLGMINADGPQDLIVYVLTKEGRVETTNYRTVKLPTGMDLPEYVQEEFPAFYKALFDRQVKKEGMGTVFTEYFWNMSWCDPCAASPLSPSELKQAGVFWADGSAAPQVMLTRLHLRYTPKTCPEDLFFQETQDRQNFQGRYVLRHPFRGREDCATAKDYYRQVHDRQEREAQALANLTGWNLQGIRNKIDWIAWKNPSEDAWWKKLWN